MKKILLTIVFVFFLTGIGFTQTKNSSSPVILQSAAPIYPKPAIDLRLEEKILATVKINKNGEIFSVNFDRGAKVFHVVIESALKQWKFEESTKDVRNFSISFTFTLLPFESKNYISSVFKLPNDVEIFANQVKVLNTIDTKK